MFLARGLLAPIGHDCEESKQMGACPCHGFFDTCRPGKQTCRLSGWSGGACVKCWLPGYDTLTHDYGSKCSKWSMKKFVLCRQKYLLEGRVTSEDEKRMWFQSLTNRLGSGLLQFCCIAAQMMSDLERDR